MLTLAATVDRGYFISAYRLLVSFWATVRLTPSI